MRGRLEQAFDESDLPFRVDIAEAATLNPEFRTLIVPQAVNLNCAVRKSGARKRR